MQLFNFFVGLATIGSFALAWITYRNGSSRKQRRLLNRTPETVFVSPSTSINTLTNQTSNIAAKQTYSKKKRPTLEILSWIATIVGTLFIVWQAFFSHAFYSPESRQSTDSAKQKLVTTSPVDTLKIKSLSDTVNNFNNLNSNSKKTSKKSVNNPTVDHTQDQNYSPRRIISDQQVDHTQDQNYSPPRYRIELRLKNPMIDPTQLDETERKKAYDTIRVRIN